MRPWLLTPNKSANVTTRNCPNASEDAAVNMEREERAAEGCTHLCAVGEQVLGDGQVPPPAGPAERSVARIRGRINVGPKLHQGGDHVGKALAGRQRQQRRPLRQAAGVGVCVRQQQQPAHLRRADQLCC